MNSVTAELDCEEERIDQIATTLSDINDKNITRLTVASILVGAASAVAGAYIADDNSTTFNVFNSMLTQAFRHIFLERIIQYEKVGKTPIQEDVIIGLNRLLPNEITEAQKQLALSLTGDYTPALQYYFEVSKTITITDATRVLWGQVLHLKDLDGVFQVCAIVRILSTGVEASPMNSLRRVPADSGTLLVSGIVSVVSALLLSWASVQVGVSMIVVV